MALFIGLIEINKVNHIYISSVPVDTEEFENNHILSRCSHPTDMQTATGDLNIVRNVLNNGGCNSHRTVAVIVE